MKIETYYVKSRRLGCRAGLAEDKIWELVLRTRIYATTLHVYAFICRRCPVAF